MSMEEWPDDHLDELFRKSAEEYDVPINNDDWADMSRRLDKLDQQTLFDRVSRWGGIGALVLLLLAGLGWVMYDRQPAGNRQLAASAITTPGREVAKRAVNPGQNRAGRVSFGEGQLNELAGRNVPDTPIAKATDHAEAQPPVFRIGDEPAGQAAAITAKKQPVETNELTSGRSAVIPTAAIPNARPVARKKRVVSDKAATATTPKTQREARRFGKKRRLPAMEEPARQDQSIAENLVSNPVAGRPKLTLATGSASAGNAVESRATNQPDLATRQAEPGETGQWMPSLTPATSLSSVVQQVRLPMEPQLPAVTANAPVLRPSPRLARLSVLLFASPDLSSIGLKNFERPGSNVGLAVQYQLTDRLSVNSGMMYSTKRYQAPADGYVLPSYPHLYVSPEDVLGVCNMIDIPLNIRYDWLLRPRGNGRAPARWFASAGLTSYFIQHEVYTYKYANPDDPKIKVTGWDNRAAGLPGGSFGFSNLNLSVGYERPITHRLSWQVEPFMKVPLKQVGYFQVKLLSTGAFIGLRYRL